MHIHFSTGKKGLYLHEWIAVCSCMAMLITIGIVSFINKRTTSFQQQEISVFVTGAVNVPKRVLVQTGAQIIDVLSLVELHPDAAIEKLVLETPVRSNSVVVIPRKGRLSVFVTGAVEQEGVIVLPEQARFCDLAHYISFAETADRSWVRRKKRLLKEGERICVPQATLKRRKKECKVREQIVSHNNSLVNPMNNL